MLFPLHISVFTVAFGFLSIHQTSIFSQIKDAKDENYYANNVY